MKTTSNFKTKDFKCSYLIEELGLPDDENKNLVKILVNDLEDSDRWTLDYRLVFQLIGEETYYELYYSRAWEFKETVTARIVEPKEVTVIEYVPVKNND